MFLFTIGFVLLRNGKIDTDQGRRLASRATRHFGIMTIFKPEIL